MLVCRINPKTKRPEGALVKKRYTYAFHKFVHVQVSAKNERALAALFERMTPEELNDVRSLDFRQMWYRVWLSNEASELFTRKLARFNASFTSVDGGARLLRIAGSVRAGGSLIWEPPGGQKAPAESDISCAIRELAEEANIEKPKYRVVPDVRRRTSFIHMGVKYVKVYYVAVASPWLAADDNLERTFQARDVQRAAECGEVRWFDIEQIRLIDKNKRLESLVAPLFRVVKRYIQGKRVGAGASISVDLGRAKKADASSDSDSSASPPSPD
ncbi:MAG: NUDIX hydrolase [Patescibacteria group bacterium]|nr:NUDIX hydrolase [Patescibacteria group bacterium]